MPFRAIPSRVAAVLGLMAAATMGNAAPMPASHGLRVQLCGGGTVELPVPGRKDDRQDRPMGCHALCEHRRGLRRGCGPA
ncbi:hypothetical protein [Sphingobium aquiterrae]|uniref:hypothetical protein n=1 Tax=Sphingobium aquiterrae TaxID=2038656 RepID=UPI003017A6E0